MDKYQLGQTIRMKAGSLDVATRTRRADMDVKKADRDELEQRIGEWRSAGYIITPDIRWAQERMDKFDQFLERPGVLLSRPVQDTDPGTSLMDMIKSRRSVRLWEKKAVPREMIMQILEAGVYAPTAFNRMPWRFFVSTRPAEALQEPDASNQGMFDSAPLSIFVGVDDRLFFEKYSAPMDAAFAMQNMLLVAHQLRLGACLVYQGEFADRDMLAREYQVPDYCTIYCAMLIGYPAEEPETPARMPVEEITTFIEG